MKLWLRLSLAFALVLIGAFLLVVFVIQLNNAQSETPPPPEVVAYFEQLRLQSVAPNPFLAFVVICILAIIAGVLVSRTLSAPISDLQEAATAVGRGDLDTRVEPRGSVEMVAVALAFNDMAIRLQQAESQRRSLLADVAHELRHPLHVLQGNLQAMQDGVYPIDAQEIDRLIAQTRQLTVIVNDLHVLSQAEARQLPLKAERTDIAALVKDAVTVYQPLAASRQIDLHVELLGTMPAAIVVDKARIRQAIQNLLENALRHTADQGHIAVRVSLLDKQLTIAVQDDGEGIDPEQLSQIFDRLYRGDPVRVRSSDSTGLGLSISKALIEAHGGTLQASSDGPGRGSIFTIILPLN